MKSEMKTQSKLTNLMKSTSGVRGIVGPSLNAPLVVEYGAALGTVLKKNAGPRKVVVGRDSRPSGEHLSAALISGLNSVGVGAVDLGVVPTPTLELAVKGLKADAGVCVTASHNTAEWNALKFFDNNGEFMDDKTLAKIEATLEKKAFKLQPFDKLGKRSTDGSWVEKHIKQTLKAPSVDTARVRQVNFTAVVDAVNGAGSYALPELLRRMGVKVIELHCKPTGQFPRTPEPTPENLSQLSRAVKRHKADLGLACDPDADRLALIDERGKAIGEELTLSLAVRQVLSNKSGPVVVNLSTSRVIEDVAKEHSQKTYYSKVGEANVVAEMKKRKSLIGGEGNGGVIYGALHYGRDSLIGAALIMTLLAKAGRSLSDVVKELPAYFSAKDKAPLPRDFDKRLSEFEKSMSSETGGAKIDRRDGVRLDFKKGWILIRASNTEPIYRVVVETQSERLSQDLLKKTKAFFK